jgi:putative transmembrane protein PGPGW
MRVVKIVGGFGLLGCGVAMLALPGPGSLMIAAALAILAAEFEWARRSLSCLRDVGDRCRDTIRQRKRHGSHTGEAPRARRR